MLSDALLLIFRTVVKRLKNENYWVRGVDLKYPEFGESLADEFIQGDLRDPDFVQKILDKQFDEVYQLAADMGGKIKATVQYIAVTLYMVFAFVQKEFFHKVFSVL